MAGRQAWRSYLSAQARVSLGLAAAFDGAVLARLARIVSGPARVEETRLGGVPATVFSPGRGHGPWPSAVIVPGVTRAGRLHPAFVGIGRGLAATGRVAFVVEPEGLISGELTLAVVARVCAAAQAAASLPDAEGGRVALVGVSGGATLALLAAAELAGRVSVVAALAPCCDTPEAIRLVTTGVYRDGDTFTTYETGDFFKLVIARSAVAWLPEGPDRTALRARLRSLDDYGPDPLAHVRAWPRDALGPSALAVVELLANEDPERFDELYAALPGEARNAAEALSPVLIADRIAAPVELVVARGDKYIPLADSTSFAKACPHATLTVIESLAHAVPLLSVREARDLARLDAVLVRLVAASYSGR